MNAMEILGVIRWVAMGFFVVFFYLYEIKKKKAFTIPAHVAILIAIILHAIVRDWYLICESCNHRGCCHCAWRQYS